MVIDDADMMPMHWGSSWRYAWARSSLSSSTAMIDPRTRQITKQAFNSPMITILGNYAQARAVVMVPCGQWQNTPKEKKNSLTWCSRLKMSWSVQRSSSRSRNLDRDRWNRKRRSEISTIESFILVIKTQTSSCSSKDHPRSLLGQQNRPNYLLLLFLAWAAKDHPRSSASKQGHDSAWEQETNRDVPALSPKPLLCSSKTHQKPQMLKTRRTLPVRCYWPYSSSSSAGIHQSPVGASTPHSSVLFPLFFKHHVPLFASSLCLHIQTHTHTHIHTHLAWLFLGLGPHLTCRLAPKARSKITTEFYLLTSTAIPYPEL